ncbi:MAG: phytanoyl-CoA dioxygenase family protein [Gammaproteobacteria bacterium]|nr:phytanoyl-CoA dioxygenase family protein [Gammaproteobacteria bacterium]NNF59759.1 phytanoyl-CoA dioxygenase family protein [Gammaproteobacteria bacterium]NNM20953.1 phytanoyl-CoA dioxygenase family protein [Gammaproteobacteria bacterium]
MQATEPLAIKRFERDGYLVVPGLVDAAIRRRMLDVVNGALEPLQGPAEFETEVGYPGSPASRSAAGGDTVRRLLHVYSRDDVFRQWVSSPDVVAWLRVLMGSEQVMLSQGHHNCVMTKYPGYSSRTMWHQDIRYWSFDRPELVSVWLALGAEREINGALKVIPGSHVTAFDRGRLDRDLFLRPELAQNAELIDQARVVELEPGDTLFFHSRLFHCAGRNDSDTVKYSAVFTYHTADNRPIPGTRSSNYPSIAV